MSSGTVRPAGPAGRAESGPGALLRMIRESGGLTTRELIAASGLARATVESRLARLVGAGFVIQSVRDRPKGRPPQVFLLNEAGGLLVSVLVGPTRTSLSLTDLGCRPLATVSFDADVTSGPGLVLGEVATRLRQLIAHQQVDPSLVMGLAVGVPGAVDLSGGLARPPLADLPGLRTEWADVHIAREVRAFLPALHVRQVPVVVDNTANFVALGEWLTSWPQARNLLVVSLDMTLACGIISNGQVLRGANGMAGDLGHIPDEASEIRCVCGQRGCAAAVASGEAVAKLLGDKGAGLKQSNDLVRLAQSGDAQTLELLRRGAHRLGVVVGSAISTLDPELVVIGGGLIEGLPSVADVVRRTALAQVHPVVAAHTAVLTTRMSAEVGIVGAARLAREEALSPAQVDGAIDVGLVLRAPATRGSVNT